MELGILLTQGGWPIIKQVAQIMGKLLDWIYSLGVHNIGICIIILTFIVYALMLPLTIKQQKFSKLSSVMQPEIREIQKKYKDKRDQASMAKMQQETKAVYDKYGTSATGGCLNLLITMPLLFAFYSVVSNIPAYVTSLKNTFLNSGVITAIINAGDKTHIKFSKLVADPPIRQSVTSFSNSTASKNKIIDSLWKFNSNHWDKLKEMLNNSDAKIDKLVTEINKSTHFLCYNIIETPQYMLTTAWGNKQYAQVFFALLIPILSGLTQWINIKLMPQPQQDPESQMGNSLKMMNVIMPIFSIWITFTLPIGLGIYWIAAAVFRSIQQVIINKHLDKMGLDEIIRKNREKQEKKREKKGIPSGNELNEKASISTRSIKTQATNDTKKNVENKGKDGDSMGHYNKNAKPGSLAAKANMVRDFNEGKNK